MIESPEIRLELHPGREIRLISPPLVRGVSSFKGDCSGSHCLGSNNPGEAIASDCPDSVRISSLRGLAASDPVPSANLVNRAESETPVNRVTKFTRLGRRTLQRAGAVLDEIADSPSELLFCTGTIPSVSAAAWAAVALYSGWIVHRLKAWVGKRVPGKLDFYCWEWQKRGALHLHYVVHVPTVEVRDWIRAGFHAEWCRLLDTVGQLSGADLFLGADGQDWSIELDKVRAEAEECRKSPAAYLSKYLGKGAEDNPAADVPVDYFYPTRWWGVSRPLRQAVCERTKKITISCGGAARAAARWEDLIACLKSNSECVFDWPQRVAAGRGAVSYGSELSLMELLEMAGSTDRIKATYESVPEFVQRVLEGVYYWAVDVEPLIEANQRIWPRGALDVVRRIRVIAALRAPCDRPDYPFYAESLRVREILNLVSNELATWAIPTIHRDGVHKQRARLMSAAERIRPLCVNQLSGGSIVMVRDDSLSFSKES